MLPSKRPGAPGARPAVLPSTDPRAPYLPNPATKLTQAGRKQEAMIAWEKCAEANERTGNDWHAGKHLEQCASLARDLALHDQVVAYAERACAAYVSAGRAQRGAECLGKIARLIDEAAPDEAYDLASRACEMLEDDGKAANARDFYSLAGAYPHEAGEVRGCRGDDAPLRRLLRRRERARQPAQGVPQRRRRAAVRGERRGGATAVRGCRRDRRVSRSRRAALRVLVK